MVRSLQQMKTDVKEDTKKISEKDQVKSTADLKPSSEKNASAF